MYLRYVKQVWRCVKGGVGKVGRMFCFKAAEHGCVSRQSLLKEVTKNSEDKKWNNRVMSISEIGFIGASRKSLAFTKKVI